jgi:hypothetical protein
MNEDTYQDTHSSHFETEKLFELIRKAEIGTNKVFSGPFGTRKSKKFYFIKKYF